LGAGCIAGCLLLLTALLPLLRLLLLLLLLDAAGVARLRGFCSWACCSVVCRTAASTGESCCWQATASAEAVVLAACVAVDRVLLQQGRPEAAAGAAATDAVAVLTARDAALRLALQLEAYLAASAALVRLVVGAAATEGI
jgi:hypothetical protein